MKITIEELYDDTVEVINLDQDHYIAKVEYDYVESTSGPIVTKVYVRLQSMQEVEESGEDIQANLSGGASQSEAGAGDSPVRSFGASRLFDDRGNRRVYGG